jgi:hypothetical protein
MTDIDANQEVIALIRTTINAVNQTPPKRPEDDLQEADPSVHWALGSPLHVTTSRALEGEMKHSKLYHRFHTRLLEFLVKNLQDENIPDGFAIKVA